MIYSIQIIMVILLATSSLFTIGLLRQFPLYTWILVGLCVAMLIIALFTKTYTGTQIDRSSSSS